MTLSGFTVIALNNARQPIVHGDAATLAFIPGFVLPLAAGTMAPSQRPLDDESKARLTLSLNATPNMKDKVAWDPGHHGWKLSLEKPRVDVQPFTDPQGRPLRVDPELPADQYTEEKIAAYYRALKAWNQIDGSNRQRIAIPLLVD